MVVCKVKTHADADVHFAVIPRLWMSSLPESVRTKMPLRRC